MARERGRLQAVSKSFGGSGTLSKTCFLTKMPCPMEAASTGAGELVVFLGYQFRSYMYPQVELLNAVQQAVTLANGDLLQSGISLRLERVGAEEGIHIQCEICQTIRRAEVCLFEVSDHNPNVLFELGLAVGKEVILLKSLKSAQLPSDLAGIKYLAYDPERWDVLHVDAQFGWR
jgi:hypothetical protein